MSSLFIFLFSVFLVWYTSSQQQIEQERGNVTEFMNWIKNKGMEYLIHYYLAVVAPIEIVEFSGMGRGVSEGRR